MLHLAALEWCDPGSTLGRNGLSYPLQLLLSLPLLLLHRRKLSLPLLLLLRHQGV